MISFILYTHSSYSDCWSPYQDRMHRHLDPFFTFDKYAIFTDKIPDCFDKRFQEVNYNEADSYVGRLYSCISTLDSEYVMFSHEDMILYNNIHEGYFLEAIQAAQCDGVDFIKLIKADDNYIDRSYNESRVLKRVPISANMMFSIQPSIWKRDTFLEVLGNNLGKNIWSLEGSGQNILRDIKYTCLYTYDKQSDKKRGKYHYDSCTFPYIATAIIKGKWNVQEYKEEMTLLGNEYGLDFNIRGIV